MSLSVSEIQREAGEKWIKDFYLLMETFDLAKFATTCFTPDVTFNFSNMPPVKGPEGIISVFGKMGGGVNSMKHELRDVTILPDRIMAASTVSYGFVNGEKTQNRALAILYKSPEDDKAKMYDIYGDFTPVFQILGALQAKASGETV